MAERPRSTPPSPRPRPRPRPSVMPPPAKSSPWLLILSVIGILVMVGFGVRAWMNRPDPHYDEARRMKSQ